MRGRPEDWGFTLAGRPLRLSVDAAAAAGFRGLWVEGKAPGVPADVRAELLQLTGGRILASGTGLLFADLAGARRRLSHALSADELRAIRKLTLHPLRLRWAGDFWPEEKKGTETWHWSKRAAPALEIFNPSGSTRRIAVTGAVATSGLRADVNVRIG